MDSLDESNSREALATAIDTMWRKFLPEIRARAQVLEDAAESATAGKLTPAEREAAQGAAHKLAGTLGTFGLGRGTRLARELEQMYSGPGAVSAERVTEMAAEIYAIIEGRK